MEKTTACPDDVHKTITFGKNSGFGTVEIVLIIAVLISLALLFRTAITSYATRLITSVFGDQSILASSMEENGGT